jgi:(+)-trans-carveol dehydrogenase
MLYLASDDGKFVTGVALPVDAGMTSQPPGITPFIGKRLWELSQ